VRPSLYRTALLVIIGTVVGVAAGFCCAMQDEDADRDEEVVVRRPAPPPQRQSQQKPQEEQQADRFPWLRIAGAPPTRLHYCLFFGAWGGIVGGLVAAGGRWESALQFGFFGGLIGLLIERAAVGLMAARGFVADEGPKLALIAFVAFASATAGAHLSSVRDKKQPKKRLPEPV
jgi:predicted lipid-binding transport protein (Tim44 family)